MIKCVVFDMDDTLYDEREYCKSGFRTVSALISEIKGVEKELIFEVLWRKFESGQYENLFNLTLDELGISYDDDFIAQLVQHYRSHKPAIKLPIESRDVLERLKQRYKLALITDGFLPAQSLKVDALDIGRYFDCIVYTEELGREFWKPSAVGFEKILDKLNVTGEECVYIADNAKKDFISPNKLGFETVQLKRPARIHTAEPASKDAAAHYSINSITEISGLLE